MSIRINGPYYMLVHDMLAKGLNLKLFLLDWTVYPTNVRESSLF